MKTLKVAVTGASSGLGYHTALAFARAGHFVVGGARSFKAGDNADGIHRVELDVTDESSVKAFAGKALELAGGEIDVVINCAGILILGSCEETSLEEYRSVMNTDFFGMVRVNQAFLPVFRKQKHGRIVMFSSINGLMGIPYQSAYTAAKHAVEGYAECLMMETRSMGIEVCLVEPGDHRSGSDSYRKHASRMTEQSPYAETYASTTYVIHRDETGGSDPDRLGDKIVNACQRRKLPCRLCIASADQHLAVWLHDLLNPGFNNAILRSYYYNKLKK